MLCPYCGFHKDPSDLSDEHILPQALGGALTPVNPFKIKTCGTCNNLCGQFVDGPFCRSFPIHLARRSAGKMAFHLAADSTIPLAYMGRLEAWSGPDVCDSWIGPTGDSIYHFHEAYEESPTIVGMPLGAKRKRVDPGVVFVGIRATNPYWHPVIARSVKAEFPRSAIHYINVAHEGVGPPYPAVPSSLNHKLEWAAALNGRQISCSIALDPNCGDRFLAKVALGVGSLVLGAAFDESEHACQLRKFLWARDPHAREGLGVRGTAFSLVGHNREMESLLSWRNCHTIMLKPVGDMLVLAVNVYGQHGMGIVLALNSVVWRDCVSEMGTVWVVCPGLRQYAGPMDFFEFYSDAHRPSPRGPLMDIAARIDAMPPLPPVHLPGSTGEATEMVSVPDDARVALDRETPDAGDVEG